MEGTYTSAQALSAERFAGPWIRTGPWPGAATIIITRATASISAPAAAVRPVVLARSRLITAVISFTPFPGQPCFPFLYGRNRAAINTTVRSPVSHRGLSPGWLRW